MRGWRRTGGVWVLIFLRVGGGCLGCRSRCGFWSGILCVLYAFVLLTLASIVSRQRKPASWLICPRNRNASPFIIRRKKKWLSSISPKPRVTRAAAVSFLMSQLVKV